jgi:hypothetical protein
MSTKGAFTLVGSVSMRRIALIAVTLLYTFALVLSYRYLIVPSFAYLGLVYRPESFAALAAAEGLALMPSLWMPIRILRPSQIIYSFLYYLVAIPTLLVMAMVGILPTLSLVKFGVIIVLMLAAGRLVYEVPLLRIPKFIQTDRGLWMAVGAIAALLYGFIFSQYGFYTEIPSLSEVYQQRAQFRNTVTGYGQYPFFWIAKAINPFLIAKGLIDRNPVWVAAGFGGQLILFAMSGLKSILFSFVLIIGVIITLYKGGKYFTTLIAGGLTGVIGLSALVDWLLGFSVVTSLFVRRLMIVPGITTTYFFDFFSSNSHAFLGHSVFSSFVEYPYSSRPAFLIGNVYYSHVQEQGSIAMSANANLWADGYANFGLFGIVLFTIALLVTLWVIDSLAKRSDLKIATLILAYPAYMLVNTKLQTSMLTHGVIVVILILYLIPYKREPEVRE